ncbi:MAG: hypothetical protein ACO3AF_03790, partial [Flavobacteriales bacterium]
LMPNSVEISTLEILSFEAPILVLRVVCSKGTYIRSLAHDIGQSLGCGAYLSGLKRTRSGEFTLQGAWTMDDFRAAVSGTRESMLQMNNLGTE